MSSQTELRALMRREAAKRTQGTQQSKQLNAAQIRQLRRLKQLKEQRHHPTSSSGDVSHQPHADKLPKDFFDFKQPDSKTTKETQSTKGNQTKELPQDFFDEPKASQTPDTVHTDQTSTKTSSGKRDLPVDFFDVKVTSDQAAEPTTKRVRVDVERNGTQQSPEDPSTSLPQGFFDDADEDAAVRGVTKDMRKVQNEADDWAAFENFTASIEKNEEEREQEEQQIYNDRAERANIEAEVYKLRAQSLREQHNAMKNSQQRAGMRQKRESEPQNSESNTASEDDVAWSLLTTAVLPAPALTKSSAQELMRDLRQRRAAVVPRVNEVYSESKVEHTTPQEEENDSLYHTSWRSKGI